MSIFATIKEGVVNTFNFATSVDYSGIMVLLLIVLLISLIWNLNKKEGSFDLNDLFVDTNGKASTSRISAVVALILSSWAFVHLTLNDKLTEWFFAGYMAIWVLNRSFSKWTDIKSHIESQDKK